MNCICKRTATKRLTHEEITFAERYARYHGMKSHEIIKRLSPAELAEKRRNYEKYMRGLETEPEKW